MAATSEPTQSRAGSLLTLRNGRIASESGGGAGLRAAERSGPFSTRTHTTTSRATSALTLSDIHFHATEGETSRNRGPAREMRVVFPVAPLCQISRSFTISPALWYL